MFVVYPNIDNWKTRSRAQDVLLFILANKTSLESAVIEKVLKLLIDDITKLKVSLSDLF